MDEDLQRKIRTLDADPDNDPLRREIERLLSRIDVPRCVCLKEPFRFYVCQRDLIELTGGINLKDAVLKSRWVDALQQSFSKISKQTTNTWDRGWKPSKQAPAPPIAPKTILMIGAEFYGLCHPPGDLLTPEETFKAIYDVKAPWQLPGASKIPKGYCKRCKKPRKNTKISPQARTK